MALFILALDYGRNLNLIATHLIAFYSILDFDTKKLNKFKSDFKSKFILNRLLIIFIIFYCFMWYLPQGGGYSGIADFTVNSSILKIALEYTKTFGGRVISFCQDEFLSKKGVLNESIVSTELGLKGIPNISESINLYRDIEILAYAGGKIHIPYVTTSKGVNLIREAKGNEWLKHQEKEFKALVENFQKANILRVELTDRLSKEDPLDYKGTIPDPTWTKELMSDDAKLALDIF